MRHLFKKICSIGIADEWMCLINPIGMSHENYISCSAQEQQIWKIISREILNLSLNAKNCISKNMAPFLYVFRTKFCIQREIKNFTQNHFPNLLFLCTVTYHIQSSHIVI